MVLRPDRSILDRVATNLGDQFGLSHSHNTMFHHGRPAHSTNYTHAVPPFHDRANATFVFLCRNSDIEGVVSSIQQVEDRFNRRYQYPWVFLNEEPFTEEFKECVSL